MICHQHAVWIYIGNRLPILMLRPTQTFTPVVFRVLYFCGRVETAPGPEANTCFLCGLVHSILYGLQGPFWGRLLWPTLHRIAHINGCETFTIRSNLCRHDLKEVCGCYMSSIKCRCHREAASSEVWCCFVVLTLLNTHRWTSQAFLQLRIIPDSVFAS